MNEKIIINGWTHRIFYYKDSILVKTYLYFGVKSFQEQLSYIKDFRKRKNPRNFNDVLTNFKKVFSNIDFCL